MGTVWVVIDDNIICGIAKNKRVAFEMLKGWIPENIKDRQQQRLAEYFLEKSFEEESIVFQVTEKVYAIEMEIME